MGGPGLAAAGRAGLDALSDVRICSGPFAGAESPPARAPRRRRTRSRAHRSRPAPAQPGSGLRRGPARATRRHSQDRRCACTVRALRPAGASVRRGRRRAGGARTCTTTAPGLAVGDGVDEPFGTTAMARPAPASRRYLTFESVLTPPRARCSASGPRRARGCWPASQIGGCQIVMGDRLLDAGDHVFRFLLLEHFRLALQGLDLFTNLCK